MQYQTFNPANGTALENYRTFNREEIESRLAAARDAFLGWRNYTVHARAKQLGRIAELLRENKDYLAALITQEMGKPIVQSRSEIDKCAWVCDFYAERGGAFLLDESMPTDAEKSYASFAPLGVILAIMPWNFPFWQVFRFAAPALMAGNAGVLKHSSNTTACALEIEKLFQHAGLPENLFTTLLLEREQVNDVIHHPGIAAVTLTGSPHAGKKVAAAAGAALKKSVLELGGSDAYLILEDADIDAAAKACATSRLINSGQSCIAAKRFIVVDSVRHEFEEALTGHMQNALLGDPTEETTDVGPLAREDLRETLHEQVQQSIDRGARCLIGGVPLQGPGFYYSPTVLTDVTSQCAAYREELFGPVAAIIPVQDEQTAIEVANDSVYGLGSAVFTADTGRGEQVARQLEAGCCFINDFVRSDPRLPFGGVKESGYGRELSHYGIKEFVNIKTVSVRGGE